MKHSPKVAFLYILLAQSACHAISFIDPFTFHATNQFHKNSCQSPQLKHESERPLCVTQSKNSICDLMLRWPFHSPSLRGNPRPKPLCQAVSSFTTVCKGGLILSSSSTACAPRSSFARFLLARDSPTHSPIMDLFACSIAGKSSLAGDKGNNHGSSRSILNVGLFLGILFKLRPTQSQHQ